MIFRDIYYIRLIYKMPSAWNMFVKKIYEEGKSKNPTYEFKQALVDASKRKSEMKTGGPSMTTKKHHRKSSKKSRGKKRTRKHRRH